MSTIPTKFSGFFSRHANTLATIVGGLGGGLGGWVLILNERDRRVKAATGISDVETKLNKKMDDLETKLTNVNQTTKALILTTATMTMQGLDGNKQPLRDWLKKANTLCRAQFGHYCGNLEVDIGKSAAGIGEPVRGVNR